MWREARDKVHSFEVHKVLRDHGRRLSKGSRIGQLGGCHRCYWISLSDGKLFWIDKRSRPGRWMVSLGGIGKGGIWSEPMDRLSCFRRSIWRDADKRKEKAVEVAWRAQDIRHSDAKFVVRPT